MTRLGFRPARVVVQLRKLYHYLIFQYNYSCYNHKKEYIKIFNSSTMKGGDGIKKNYLQYYSEEPLNKERG